jgi:hypothetical protein
MDFGPIHNTKLMWKIYLIEMIHSETENDEIS